MFRMGRVYRLSNIASQELHLDSIAQRFRPKVLPDDRDDIEIEIVLKLKTEADKQNQVTLAFHYLVP